MELDANQIKQIKGLTAALFRRWEEDYLKPGEEPTPLSSFVIPLPNVKDDWVRGEYLKSSGYYGRWGDRLLFVDMLTRAYQNRMSLRPEAQ